MANTNDPLESARRFLAFVNASPTPFHAVHNASLRLEQAGFHKLREKDDWERLLNPGGKFYLTRNQSSLLAFALPQAWERGAGLSIVATHVDSPNLRVRPISNRSSVGYLQVGVETYGSGLWHTYLDRDLSIAGRVIIANKDGSFGTKLVHIKQPILRIPSLAIHLNRNVNDGLKFSIESEMVPMLGLVSDQLNSVSAEDHSAAKEAASSSRMTNKHHPVLLSLLANELSIDVSEIHDFELSLYDTQPSCLGGINSEFLLSARVDNLVSSFCAVEAMAASSMNLAESRSSSETTGMINCIALFNHEEIGSVSTTGAESSLVPMLLERLSATPSALAQSVSRSFLISADMSHAVHPNYVSKHEDLHRPMLNGGVIIKTNAHQKYASDSIGSLFIKKLLDETGGEVQEYEVRNDMVCGSTVGPMLSKIGIRTVDVGLAMLSMHSIREVAGAHDIQHLINLFSSFFTKYGSLAAKFDID